jgi:hypothetical protein
LLFRQSALTHEAAMAFHTFPRGHETAIRKLDNLRSTLFEIGIGQQRKWSNFTRPMAGSAVLENNWGDIAVERDLFHRRKWIRGLGLRAVQDKASDPDQTVKTLHHRGPDFVVLLLVAN